MTLNDSMYFNFLFDGYKVSDQVDDTVDSDIMYIGFVNKVGEWYILKQDTTAGANNLQTYRYAKGTSGYTTAWTARQSQTYGYIYETFV